VTVEDVKKYCDLLPTEGSGKEPESPEEPDLPGNGPAPDALPPPAAKGRKPENAGPEPSAFYPGEQVMVCGKFLGKVTGFVETGDGKRRWLVKSPSHPSDIETVGYAPEDLAKALA